MQIFDKGVGRRVIALAPNELLTSSKLVAALTAQGHNIEAARNIVGNLFDALEEQAFVARMAKQAA